MADFTQTSGTAPDLASEVLVGDGHIIVDRPFGASLTLAQFELVSLDDTLNTWTAYDPADLAFGVVMEAVVTGGGGSKTASVCQSGAVKFSKITDTGATTKVGETIGALVFV